MESELVRQFREKHSKDSLLKCIVEKVQVDRECVHSLRVRRYSKGKSVSETKANILLLKNSIVPLPPIALKEGDIIYALLHVDQREYLMEKLKESGYDFLLHGLANVSTGRIYDFPED